MGGFLRVVSRPRSEEGVVPELQPQSSACALLRSSSGDGQDTRRPDPLISGLSSWAPPSPTQLPLQVGRRIGYSDGPGNSPRSSPNPPRVRCHMRRQGTFEAPVSLIRSNLGLSSWVDTLPPSTKQTTAESRMVNS